MRNTIAECVAAFANADGGTLVLGIEDDGTPTGHGYGSEDLDSFVAVPARRLRSPMSCDHQLLEIGEHEVLVIEVPRAPRAIMVDGDGFPYRSGDQILMESEEVINALKREYLERGVEQRLADATVDDLNLRLLPAEAVHPSWLAARGLVLPRGGSPAVMRAAVLLAGRAPVVRWHPACSVRIFNVAGTDIRHGADRNVTQVERLDLPIAELIPSAYEVARAQIRRSEKLHDLFFRETPEYPRFAWQEAIVNAVVHRDYAEQGRGVELWFFDDRMEILSPGLLWHPSRSTRCGPASAFMRAATIRPASPTSSSGSSTRSTATRRTARFRRWSRRTSFSPLLGPDRQPCGRSTPSCSMRVPGLRSGSPRSANCWSNSGHLTNADYREAFDVPRSVAVRELARLVDDRFLELVGERRASRYVPGPALRTV